MLSPNGPLDGRILPRRRTPSAGRRPGFALALLLALLGVAVAGCSRRQHGPAIHFTQVPVADAGGPVQTDVIAGRVTGGAPGQRIVLYARSAKTWWVQPTTEIPYTLIGADGAWSSRTHLGTDYAALLVEPGYRPLSQLTRLPAAGGGVAAVAERSGRLRVSLAILSRLIHFSGYGTWWFNTCLVLAVGLAAFGIHQFRMYQLTRQLNARFQERLDERTRISQELHDTLLQGFLSAAMQVDVAEEQVPDDSPAKPLLRRALQLMNQVNEEGRHVIRGLRLPYRESDSIEEVFSLLGQELAAHDKVRYSVVAEGNCRPLRPAVRDVVCRIGREALANAFKHAHAENIGVELEYAAGCFRLVVRDDGQGIDPAVLHAGRQNHWGLPGMRQRAESIGATLKLRSRIGAGAEVELVVPGVLAFDHPHRGAAWWRFWSRGQPGPKSGKKETRRAA